MIIKMRNDRRTMRRDEIRLTETRRRTERTTDQPTTTRTISDQESNRNCRAERFKHGPVKCTILNQALISSWKKGGTMFIFDTVLEDTSQA
ncbi:uncharacterized protein LOC123196221 isoform X3 [Mangifera indica]|uniref:uncharacterized protein LOC123196221 isoform X3 n=1 Tax=Mangifera indica TaxID=29780 RepID=UPI001CFB070F|nr:uncharacterized protein LOC123196221 isoform X3 [Mangifera indica]